MFGTTFGMTAILLLPVLAGAGMVVMGAGTALAPSILLLLPFMLVRA